MRKVFLLASLLICLTSVNVFAQEKTTTTGTEQPKNAVDQMLDEAKERGETILGSCLVDCEGVAVQDGVEPGRVLELPKPVYPPIARAAHASGAVGVKVIIDVDGTVIAAASISGHPLLQGAAVNAARNARFAPTKVNGQPVKVVGVIQYNFVIQ
ncbi:MAG TPA: TonB family protein [Pyrinomonadaceae bacterium]|nr:TonB family protein [Pyrinomonadaceae bacterium]